MLGERPDPTPVAPLERLNNEQRGRSAPADSVPDAASEPGPADALAPEQHDEW